MTSPGTFKAPSGCSAVYDYTHADGSPAFKVCRREATGGKKKSFIQFSPDPATGVWAAKQHIPPGQQPLYGLQAIAAAPDAPVLIVEGEKAAAGAVQYLPPGWLVTTWAGGSTHTKGADWSPLEGRTLVIWPDNDDPGRNAATAILARLPHAHIVTVPVQFPDKWDLADALPEGFDAGWVRAKIIHATSNGRDATAQTNLPSTLNGAHSPALHKKPILLVDSDTTAIAAMQYLPPGWVAHVYDLGHASSLTSLGSPDAAIIWGRNDEGGRTWAESVADAVGIPCYVVQLAAVPVHWGLGDPLPPGRTAGQLTAYLQGALTRVSLRASPGQAPPPPVAVATAAPGAPSPPVDNTDLPFIRSGARGEGQIKPLMHNAALLLQHNQHRWDLRFNDFANRACLGTAYITDADALHIARWVQTCGVHCSVGTIHEAIAAVAGQNRFHPVRAYLDSLTWDRFPRLDLLFVDHASADNTPLNRAMSSKWMIQAVARIYEPGCQADGTLVLEGVQGLRKSTFFRELFGDQWFTDHLPDITSKDALLQLRGVWCVEIGELATLGRAESAKIKQFLTSRIDRYRDPFGRMVADFPRTCVFAGSINPGAGGYLKDETGARRFWPLVVRDRIDIGAVAAIRDQLWAEAVARHHAGERWFLDTDALESAAQQHTADRFASDPWQERIDEFLLGRTEVTVAEIFKVALNLPDVGKWDQTLSNRISRCLAFANWVRVRRGKGVARRWAYVPGDSSAARHAGDDDDTRPDVRAYTS